MQQALVRAIAGAALAAAALAAAGAASAPAAPGADLSGGRWQTSFAAFAAADAAQRPAPGGIVFVGSSSIRLWSDLETQFGERRIVKRGFGGSSMADCARYADRLVVPYRPRLVVVYAGDNDLAEGRTPAQVLDSYARFVEAVQAALPDTRIAYLSIKPSPRRAALMPAMRETNAAIAAWSRRDPRLDFIDVYSPMLDGDGRPRPELFRADALHLNAAGYRLWKEAIAAHLR